eukprot:211123_1
MSSLLQNSADKVLQFVGYKDPSSTSKFWAKAAIIGGSIGVSLIIALIPVTVKVSNNVAINKSAKEVYDYLSETNAEQLWPRIHPTCTEVKIDEANSLNNRQRIIFSEDIGHKVISFPVDIVKNSATKAVILDCIVPLLYGLKFNSSITINDDTNIQSQLQTKTKMAVPLILYFSGKKGLENSWGSGKEAVAYAIKDAMEDS